MLDTIDRRRLRACLRQIYVFAGVERGELDEICDFSALSYVDAGQRLFTRHEPCRTLFQVARGLVKMTRRVARGGEQVLDIAAPGRMLGLTAMFTGSGYPFDAVAMNDTELVVVQSGPLMAYFEARPGRLLRLCTELARRHERMVVRIDQVIGRSAPERVALCLLRASEPNQTDPSICALFGDVRRADIANMLGVTPETFSRVLARFRREGWIDDVGGMPCVVDRQGLVSLLGEEPLEQAGAGTAGVVAAAAV